MSDLLQSETEVDEQVEEDEIKVDDVQGKVKVKKRKLKALVSDDEEEDGDDAEVVKDLIDDTPIEDEVDDDDSDDDKSRNSDDLLDILEDDDYDLIEENLGVKVQRRKFKRVKRMVDDDSDLEDSPGNARDKIADQLFEGSSDHEDDKASNRDRVRETSHYASESEEGEYSETDDFIVDDDSRPVSGDRRRHRPVFSNAALQQAQDVFGVEFDFDEVEKFGNRLYEDDEDKFDEEENFRGSRIGKPRRNIHEVFEPYELERAGLSDLDSKVRAANVPERLLVRNVPVTGADNAELEEEAEWIYSKIFKNTAQVQINLVEPKVIEEMDPPKITEPEPDPEQSEVVEEGWGRDWDEHSQISRVVQPNQAHTTTVPVPWGDWDSKSQASQTAPPTNKASIPAVAPTTTPWANDWDASSQISRVVPPSHKTATSIPIPASAPTTTPWGDWDSQSQASQMAPPTIKAPAPDTTIPIPATAPTTAPWAKNWDSATHVPPRSTITSTTSTSQPQIRKEPLKPNTTLIKKIKKVLDLIRNQLFEVPFIGFYRKDFVQPELTMDKLWEIYRLDAKFCAIRKRKQRLATLFRNMQKFLSQHNKDDTLRPITDEDIERIEEVMDPLELRDEQLLFTLYYADKVPDMKAALKKKEENKTVAEMESDQTTNETVTAAAEENTSGKVRVIGGTQYKLCKKLGIDGFLQWFGLSPVQFADNVANNYKKHEVVQTTDSPNDIALQSRSGNLNTPEAVLNAAVYMMATQISREPLVRKTVRRVFFENATVSCYPTAKGRSLIDESHPCYA